MHPARHFGMDWLRIGAFALLILYHITMAFSPWPYRINMEVTESWVVIPMFAVNPWRLILLFVVSGYASSALLAKLRRPGAFLKSRTRRLIPPLIFGIIVIVPPQAWIQLITQKGYTAGFGSFLLHDYFSFRSIRGVLVPGWNHLWFVAYLFVYTAGLSLLALLPAGPRLRAAAIAERALAGPLVFLLPAAALAAFRLAILPDMRENTQLLIDDWPGHAVYFSAFLFGVLLRNSAACWQAIRTWWKAAAAIAILAYILYAVREGWLVGTPLSRSLFHTIVATRAILAWTAIIGLIGMADRFLDHDWPGRKTLAEAVFPFYIIHQTIIVVVGWLLLESDLSLLARYLLLVAATAAGCWIFYDIGRRIAWLRPLIGLQAHPAWVQMARPSAAEA
ncbi:acyltransferase family protein [Stakelama saccharophila]|uniref:Acyltransferase n=1 Tax=Stakelama saccharophila TaxID=3075605 RepID=A0ABZ0BB28_9SPHN|nr:acyltransferase [Stakelama sp. W311]WNO54622.1 acyltransferase [Stakelama sp. W311]